MLDKALKGVPQGMPFFICNFENSFLLKNSKIYNYEPKRFSEVRCQKEKFGY